MNRILQIRKRNGLSQQQAADLMHISRKNYGRVERGELMPSSRFLLRFSKAMNVGIDEILSAGPVRSVPVYSSAEETILSLYRMLDRSGRDYIYRELLTESAISAQSSLKEGS